MLRIASSSSSSVLPILLLLAVFLFASLDALRFDAEAAAATFRLLPPPPPGQARSKRQALSVTQDLMSLADIIHEEAMRRRVKNARNQLAALGRKRSRPFFATDAVAVRQPGYAINHLKEATGTYAYDVAPSYDDWEDDE